MNWQSRLSFYLRNVEYTRHAFHSHWFWSNCPALHRLRNKAVWALARLLDPETTIYWEHRNRAVDALLQRRSEAA